MKIVARIRKARGLSQGDLAEMAKVKQPHVSRLENGEDGVTLRVVYRVADALELPVAALFADNRSEAEESLLQAFRKLPQRRKDAWLEMARLAEAEIAGQEVDQMHHQEDLQ